MGEPTLVDGLVRRLRQPVAPARRCAPPMAYGRHQGPARPDTRHASVLLLLYEDQGSWHLPLTRRQPHLAHHGGQICLPGGSVESGESSADAARREAAEELGVPVAANTLLGQLPPVYVFNSNFLVTPWIAVANQRPSFCINSDEVAELIALPIAVLQDQDRRSSVKVERGGLRFTAPSLRWQSHEIWGATRLILFQFSACLPPSALPGNQAQHGAAVQQGNA